jgi:ABC-2 type transport system ATP-binding protein
MRLIATLDIPDSGTIEVNGSEITEEPAKVRPHLGWMPDHTGAYDLTTVLDYLDFFARALGLRGPRRTQRLREVLEFTELTGLVDRPMRGLSKGQTQRLALARTLLHDPSLLILDEPAAGLDPKARVEFKNLVRLLRDQGKTLLISSHILSELGEMCDTLLFIDNGRIVHHGTAESLRRGGGESVRVLITVAGDATGLREWIPLHPGWTFLEATRTGARAEFASTDAAALAAELRRMVTDGLAVAGFAVEEQRLEDAFIDMLRKLGNGDPLTPPPVASRQPLVDALGNSGGPPPSSPPPLPPPASNLG